MRMEIEHFSHHHTLFLSDEKEGCELPCDGCSRSVMGLVYCCKQCVFVLHKWCAELPHQIHDQSHPHALTLLLPNGSSSSSAADKFECNQCHKEGSCFRYSCGDCSFHNHVQCASFVRNHKVTYLVKGKPLEFSDLSTHPSPNQSSTCVACGYPGTTSYFTCDHETIRFHLHCAILPNTAKHPTHLHQLILSYYNSVEDDDDDEPDCELYCDACEEARNPKCGIYHCSRGCAFVSHISCANSPSGRLVQFVMNDPLYESVKHKPIDPIQREVDMSFESMMSGIIMMMERNEERNDIEEDHYVLHNLHDHPLVLRDEPFIEDAFCAACSTGTYGRTYICTQCKHYVLHEWCSKLPQQIQHHLHQEHPMMLAKRSDTWKCELCESSEDIFMGYHCNECKVSLHVLCASLPQNLLNNDLHQHSLIPVYCAIDSWLYKVWDPIFPKKFSQELPACHVCKFPCVKLSLECNECEFHVHIHCFMLPPTGKHTTHRHELVLGPPPEWDMDSDEFYCDACELQRNSKSWVYFCAECAQEKYVYAVHVDCVHPPKLISS